MDLVRHRLVRLEANRLPRRARLDEQVRGPRDGPALELTYNWDTASYDLGTGYGHIALQVENAYEACDRVKQLGGKVTREAGPMKHGSTVIAFVEDPDGYKIEFVQKKFD